MSQQVIMIIAWYKAITKFMIILMVFGKYKLCLQIINYYKFFLLHKYNNSLLAIKKVKGSLTGESPMHGFLVFKS